jgi:hypothetical protein
VSDENAEAPPYAIPEVGEGVRVYDATPWNKTVSAVYLGFERVADGFFMHRVRSDAGLENTIASYNMYRLVASGPEGDRWESLTEKPRVR